MHPKIYFGEKPEYTVKDLDNFSDGRYECRYIVETRTEPTNFIFITKSKSRSCLAWRVIFDMSTVFFDTESEAVDYVKNRFGNVRWIRK